MRVAGAKFTNRNRPPRVRIEVDVEGEHGQQKMSIPFVMGVMADLSGASASDLPDVGERKPIEIDGETFDTVLKAQKPRVRFNVSNALTAQGGDLPVDITFESLEDFSPAAIARKVEPLRKLLEAREQLQNLKLWADSEKSIPNVIEKLLNDPALTARLSAPPAADDGKAEA